MDNFEFTCLIIILFYLGYFLGRLTSQVASQRKTLEIQARFNSKMLEALEVLGKERKRERNNITAVK